MARAQQVLINSHSIFINPTQDVLAFLESKTLSVVLT